MRSETDAVEGFRIQRRSPLFLSGFNSFCQCLSCVESVGTEAEVGVKLAWRDVAGEGRRRRTEVRVNTKAGGNWTSGEFGA